MAIRNNWTLEQVRAALALYLVTPFGRIHQRNPDIIRLAERIGRTPSAVALKLTNLAALDDSLPRKGMANASKTDRQVWAEFLNDPTEVEKIYAEFETGMPGHPGMAEAPAQFDHFGGERLALTRQRIGQDLFRKSILTNYGNRCALTGADDPRLLTASHILGWKESPQHRMWPTNGICLNALHDRAFDRHLITFDPDWRMQIAPDVPSDARRVLERGVEGPLAMPSRFLPDQTLMEKHRQRFAQRAA